MSNQVVYFCSETKLKSFTAIQANVLPEDLLPHMITAQDIYLQEVLGSTFYNSLKAEIVASTTSVVNAALIDEYIAPYVLNATIYQALPWLSFKLMNKGVIAGSSEPNNKIADLNDIKYLRDNAKSTMEFYRERLRKELIIHSTLYPSYIATSSVQNLPPGRTTDYSMGIGFPKSVSKTMNQNYGQSINSQGNTNYNPNTGCTDCQEQYATPS